MLVLTAFGFTICKLYSGVFLFNWEEYHVGHMRTKCDGVNMGINEAEWILILGFFVGFLTGGRLAVWTHREMGAFICPWVSENGIQNMIGYVLDKNGLLALAIFKYIKMFADWRHVEFLIMFFSSLVFLAAYECIRNILTKSAFSMGHIFEGSF